MDQSVSTDEYLSFPGENEVIISENLPQMYQNWMIGLFCIPNLQVGNINIIITKLVIQLFIIYIFLCLFSGSLSPLVYEERVTATWGKSGGRKRTSLRTSLRCGRRHHGGYSQLRFIFLKTSAPSPWLLWGFLLSYIVLFVCPQHSLSLFHMIFGQEKLHNNGKTDEK